MVWLKVGKCEREISFQAMECQETQISHYNENWVILVYYPILANATIWMHAHGKYGVGHFGKPLKNELKMRIVGLLGLTHDIDYFGNDLDFLSMGPRTFGHRLKQNGVSTLRILQLYYVSLTNLCVANYKK